MCEVRLRSRIAIRILWKAAAVLVIPLFTAAVVRGIVMRPSFLVGTLLPSALLSRAFLCFLFHVSLFALFAAIAYRREVRLLHRHLGNPVKIGRALLFVILVTVSILLIQAIVMHCWPVVLSPIGSEADAPSSSDSTSTEDSASSAWKTSVAMILAQTAAVPVFEELLFRCGLFLFMLCIAGPKPAIVSIIMLFYAWHFIPLRGIIPWIYLLQIALASVGAIWVLLATRRIYWCILFHALLNASIFVGLGSVPRTTTITIEA